MRRMQVQDSPGYPRIYRNTADCIRSGSYKPPFSFLKLIECPGLAAICPHMIAMLPVVQADVPKGRREKLLEVRGPSVLGPSPCFPVP